MSIVEPLHFLREWQLEIADVVISVILVSEPIVYPGKHFFNMSTQGR